MSDNNEFNFDENKFTFCGKVDIFSVEAVNNLQLVCAIASEHGFRGISTTLDKLPILTKELKKDSLSDKTIKANCVLDYPYGNMSLDVRNFAINSAKQNGATGIEITLPLSHIAEKSMVKINTDLECVSNTCKKLGLDLKYIFDCENRHMDDIIKNKLAKMLHLNNIDSLIVKTSYDNVSDSIMAIRYFKSKTQCKIKAFVPASTGDDIAQYTKAGAESIMLCWIDAPRLIYEYEILIENET